MSHVLHVVVVGFHHKKGCQVEYCYPPLSEDSETSLPEQWAHLPALALPDGAHNTASDVIYFTLPSKDSPGETVFGISCYRQISANDLVAKTDDVTRSTVQKSVCVISRSPLFGVLKAKLQLITQAYFNERDFSKVEVLAQMYTNLCDMFEGDLVDGQAASMDISLQDLFSKFRHRVILLFKLMLLEKKVLFNITPVQDLGDTIIGLLSLFPKLLEEGLLHSCFMENTNTQENVIEEVPVVDAEDDEIVVRPPSPLEDTIKQHDSFGFPLAIFTEGNCFQPYASISYLDLLRTPSNRGFTVGATNVLFMTKKDLWDVIITVDEQGIGQVDVLKPELKKLLSLTAADLRFGDYLIKNIDANREASAVFEGGDEWIKLQFRNYLLSLGATARSDLLSSLGDFGSLFINEWKQTKNYKLWMNGDYEDLVGTPLGHAFAGQMGFHDVVLRVDNAVSGSEGARKALTVLSSTGKSIGEKGANVKQSLTNWFRGGGNTTPENGGEPSKPQTNRFSTWLRTSTSSPSISSSEEKPGENINSNTSETEDATISSKAKNFVNWLKNGKAESIETAEEAFDETMSTTEKTENKFLKHFAHIYVLCHSFVISCTLA
ncbi:unnamed protein product [Auanema sp. JU1783]|nr:unnamed protein product [Auanema sp. JU1783]